MNLHRALIASLICFGLLIGVTGCESCAPNGPRYPASKSSVNMSNSMWDVHGEAATQEPAAQK